MYNEGNVTEQLKDEMDEAVAEYRPFTMRPQHMSCHSAGVFSDGYETAYRTSVLPIEHFPGAMPMLFFSLRSKTRRQLRQMPR